MPDNKPKKPVTIDLAPSEYGKGLEERKNFWGGVGRASKRGKIFWLDIETTGLGKDVTALGPERFSEVAKALKSRTTLKEKLGIFKALPEYKFFKDIGLAQFVTSGGRGGAPSWHHGAGYTMWEDSVQDTLMSKRVAISDFSRIQGIGERSIRAGLANEASTMPQMLKSFSKKLLEHTASGSSTVRGWNVWFDVWATQAFMAQHAEDLQRAGHDPFGLIKAVGSKRLRVESMEENYFDLLAWRGLRDTGWAKKNLRYGRMFGAKMGEGPGSVIPIHDYIARRKEGLPNLLRGRSGWKAEKLESIFNEYGAIDKGLAKWKFPGGKSFDAWGAHDAVRDVASEYEISRKFTRINKALAILESGGAPTGAFGGVAKGEALSALAFARAGVLGEQFSAMGMRGSQWNKMVSQSGVSKEILRRSRTIWGAIEGQTPSTVPYVSRGASERIATPYGDYFRRIWNNDISGLSTADIRSDVTAKLTRAKNAWSGSGRAGKFGVIGIAALALYTAFGRQQETIDANAPYNGFEGMGHGFAQSISRHGITGSGITGDQGFGSGWRGIRFGTLFDIFGRGNSKWYRATHKLSSGQHAVFIADLSKIRGDSAENIYEVHIGVGRKISDVTKGKLNDIRASGKGTGMEAWSFFSKALQDFEDVTRTIGQESGIKQTILAQASEGRRQKIYKRFLERIGYGTSTWTKTDTPMGDQYFSKITYNYIKGQQAASKAVDVPWSSPWEGIATDDRTAVGMLARGGLAAGGAYAFYNLPGIASKFGAGRAVDSMVHGARFMEDILPFRLGRMFNVGSFWSSFSTPSDYSLGFKHLVSEGIITDVGRTYASAMDITEFDFVRSINSSKLRGYSALEHTKVSANSPFMRIRMDDIGDFDVRMFDSTTRLGNSFGAMGTESLQTRSLSGQAQARRVSHILRDAIPVGEMGIGRRLLRGASKLFPSATRSAVGRWAAVPTWDTNPFSTLQHTEEMAGQHLFVPGYARKTGVGRAAVGLGRDAIRSGYAAIRQSAAIVGIPMAGAKTMRGMTSSTVKAGAVVFAGMWAFGKVNNSLGGALTDPAFNIWERAMLARASFSDATGLTGLREQLPDVQTTAILGILGAGAGVALTYKYGVRAKGLFNEYRGASRGTYGASTWGIDDVTGFGTDIREESHRMAKASASADIKNFMFRPGLTDEWGEMLSARHYLKWSSLSGRGKVVAGALGGMAALAAPFLIGSKQSRNELEEIYAGNRNIEVKRGRWWELGSTPYEGGRTHYFRRHQIARRKLRAENRAPGEGHTGIWGLIKSLGDPYWREREAYYSRPTPVTGGTALREVPLIGPMLDAIVGGGLLKPQRYMHRDEWAAGQDYEQYPGGLAPNVALGGTSSPTPRDPTGLASQIREATYRGTELMGLRGYLAQSIGSQKLFGGDMPFDQARVLQPARFGPSATDAFWEADMGGMAGANEVFRRLFPRPERGTEVNPLRNQMPSWLPGDNYFVNFRTGDPYSKVRYGAERLPGAGYEALNPEMAGIDPENYSAFHRYKILADVAPWAAETRGARGAAYASAKGEPARLEALDRIDREVEQVKEKKNFKDYSFLAGRETIRGTVTGVGMGGEVRLAEYQNHTFTLAGLNFGTSAVADQLRRQNNMTKSAATERAAGAAYERQALLQNLMVGGMVTVSIGKGGLNKPDVAGTFTMNGRNINKMLVDRGLAGNEGGAPTAGRLTSIYGGVMEAIGHFPQKIPGPWMTMTKFFNQADPMEEYRRDVLYGSNNRFWDSPWKNFIRPYMHQTLSKLTPGEYIPSHVEKQREFDVALDRTKFLKYAQSGELGRAKRTMAGGDMYGDPSQIQAALPQRDKPFFEAFRQETDPSARKRILSMVSQDMQRALVGQWSSQYAATQGKSTGGKVNINLAVNMAKAQLKRLGRPVPPQDWAGNDPAVDWQDIKAVMVQSEGADTHDYNIWDDRTQSLLRKPYVYGAVDGLTSRRMATNINSMSSALGRDQAMPFATISHSTAFSMNMNNDVNYAAWENAQYKSNIDRMGGS